MQRCVAGGNAPVPALSIRNEADQTPLTVAALHYMISRGQRLMLSRLITLAANLVLSSPRAPQHISYVYSSPVPTYYATVPLTFTAALGNVHINFGFSPPFRFRVRKRADGLAVGRTGKTRNAAYYDGCVIIVLK